MYKVMFEHGGAPKSLCRDFMRLPEEVPMRFCGSREKAGKAGGGTFKCRKHACKEREA